MILTTGGRASGATSTRSRPRSFAAAIASSIVNTPSWSPLSAITRTGLMRICRLTRVRGALLLLSRGGRCAVSCRKEKRTRVAPPRSVRPHDHVVEFRNPGALSRERHAGGALISPAYRIVARNLVERHRLHKCDALPILLQPTRDRRRVVLEDQQPPLRLRPLVNAAAGLERDQRLQVVAHDPRHWQMSRRRHQVGDEAGLLAAALDENRLVIRYMSRRGKPANAREDLRLAVDQLKGDAREIMREVAAGGPLVGVSSKVELTFLHDVGGARK